MATLSLAFLGTVGLAKIMVDVRADDSSVVSGRQAPPDWPIAFTLPPDHRWRFWSAPSGGAASGSSDGGSMSFLGRHLSGGQGVLVVSFKVMSPGTPSEDVAREMFEQGLGVSEEIAMGPIAGRMAVKASSGGASVLASGCSAEGLGIGVAYVTSVLTGEEVPAVRSLCESIAFKEWWARR